MRQLARRGEDPRLARDFADVTPVVRGLDCFPERTYCDRDVSGPFLTRCPYQAISHDDSHAQIPHRDKQAHRPKPKGRRCASLSGGAGNADQIAGRYPALRPRVHQKVEATLAEASYSPNFRYSQSEGG